MKPRLSLLLSISFGATLLLGLFFFLPNAFAEETQPIQFSHKIHAGDDQIPCQYCHIYARRSYSSGVPPVSICIGCHGPENMKMLAPDKPEVNKVREYWKNQEPIPWVKVHDVPDFVRFPHKKHINAESSRFTPESGAACDSSTDARSLDCKVQLFKKGGDDRCMACHGDVKTMGIAEQVDQNFGDMGWCLECHLEIKGAKARKSALSTLGGWFNAKEQEQQREAQIGLKHPDGYHHPNVTDCLTCHY